MKLCRYTQKGYLDAVMQINENGESEKFGSNLKVSAFEKPVYRTSVRKVGTIKLSIVGLIKKVLNLCLLKEVSAGEGLVFIDNELPFKIALQKALQTKYPCSL